VKNRCSPQKKYATTKKTMIAMAASTKTAPPVRVHKTKIAAAPAFATWDGANAQPSKEPSCAQMAAKIASQTTTTVEAVDKRARKARFVTEESVVVLLGSSIAMANASIHAQTTNTAANVVSNARQEICVPMVNA
jgi:cell wall-associated NlpC family hydrolase